MNIITRAEWGARHAAGYGPRPVGGLARYLHHTVTRHLPVDATVAAEVAQMRAIESIGQQRFGYGISYTFVVFPSGRVYEGAGIGRVSAHTGGGRNTGGAGLCLAGNYEANELGPDAVAGMGRLLAHGVSEGWWGSPTFTAAHRDLKVTTCPGRYAYEAMPAIAAAAQRVLDGASRGGGRTEQSWRPAVRPELINERLHLMGIRTRGRLGDYDREAVAEYQAGQVYPTLVADGLWGPVTEAHYQWVVQLQQALNRVGGRTNVDGFYGPHTAFTVGRAQKAFHLPVTEKADETTCHALKVRSHP